MSLLLPLSALRTQPFPTVRSPWLLNTKDLLAGETEYATSLTWLGVYRRRDSYVFSVAQTVYGARITRRIELAFFRRVSPVETKRYALLRNLAALLAITVILVRAVTLLAQAQGQVFQTTTLMERCWWSNVTRSNVQLVVSHSGTNLTMLLPGLGYNMSLAIFQRGFRTGYGSDWEAAGQCSAKTVVNARDGSYDIFDVFTCQTPPNSTLFNTRYDVTIRGNNNTSLDALVLPNMWLNYGPSKDFDPVNKTSVMPTMTPWLVPSWQLAAGIHTEAEIGMAKRRFIVSPFIRDTLGGMKPKYLDVTLFPITTLRDNQLANLSIASGSMVPSTRIQFTSANTLRNVRNLHSQPMSLAQICEVVQDYRASTAFDALGSVGGLLAILQGLHILLFGRPMFWGIFGAKLLTPFGLLGNWSSGGLRRRLREHYYSSPQRQEDGEPEKADTMRLHTFLRDYVIDFGPADSNDEARLA